MLALDSPRWATLTGAYGRARAVPAMIEAVRRDPGDEEAWESIWSTLCHQGSVYPASYAAVPHLVAIATALPPSRQARFWTFVGAVACSPDAAPLPASLRAAYRVALAQARPLVEALLPRPMSRTTRIYLLQTVAALRGCPATARALEDLTADELRPRCPGCATELYVAIRGARLTATVEAPERATMRRTQVEPGRLRPARPGAGRWREAEAMPRLLALVARDRRLASLLIACTGAVTCPACGHRFALWTRRVAQEVRRA